MHCRLQIVSALRSLADHQVTVRTFAGTCDLDCGRALFGAGAIGCPRRGRESRELAMIWWMKLAEPRT
eukprot:9063503-Karenia_brevis.AAC.1